MSTPHLHLRRLLQDLDHLYADAKASLVPMHPNLVEREVTKRELEIIYRRLKKELRRVSVAVVTAAPQVYVEPPKIPYAPPFQSNPAPGP